MNRKHRHLALATVLALLLAACGSLAEEQDGDGGPAAGDGVSGAQVTMARATWDTGWFQAEIYAQLLDELGYEVTDPADLTRDANTFYPALAQEEVDLWVNGWFPLHDIYLDRELFSGQLISEPIEPVGFEVPSGALQGYLIDKATADAMGINSMSQLADPSIAAVFDTDGDGLADLYGCNDGWGCHVVIDKHLDELDWGRNVEQVVGNYGDLINDVVRPRVEAGQPVLFYTWTPNWTIDVLAPGQDVVWLESPALEEDEDLQTSVSGLAGCAGADPCELGWPVNDIRAVANTEFLGENPPIRRLLEAVQLPLQDIADQNARMAAEAEYTDAMLRADATAWIEANRSLVDGWLTTARG
ncbi:MAG: glycine betaine/L-proline ABC transporter substrate-binding protein ProX [Acidimicrobiia bacterium]|nr:glycine betaine/L-proline ABC transporter substrate-binding protein ProX [Acidimicrobiia bacterium]